MIYVEINNFLQLLSNNICNELDPFKEPILKLKIDFFISL